MRSRHRTPARRRSAAEWAQLVAELRAGSLSPKDFAASRAVPVARLRWWSWRLGVSARAPAAPADELRLVPVVVEPSSSPFAAPAPPAPTWELCTAHGDVLRVYRAVAAAELQAALSALLPRGARR